MENRPQTVIERLTKLTDADLEVSFLLQLQSPLIIDCPDLNLIPLDKRRDASLLFSHTHPDHCDTRENTVWENPSYINFLALPIFHLLGIDFTKKYPRIIPLIDGEEHVIDGVGTLLPLRLSHSDISHMMFCIHTLNDKLIVCSNDNRRGNLTTSAIERGKEWMIQRSRNEIDLLIVDMNRVGKEVPMTWDMHRKDFELIRENAVKIGAPIVVRIKPGDFSQLLLWKKWGYLPLHKTFMHPSLLECFKQLATYDSIWGELVRDVSPLDTFTQLNDNTDRKHPAIYITHDPYDSVRSNIEHVHINATPKESPREYITSTRLYTNIGVSGHDAGSALDIHDAFQPLHWTASHSGSNGYRNKGDIHEEKMVLKAKGQKFIP